MLVVMLLAAAGFFLAGRRRVRLYFATRPMIFWLALTSVLSLTLVSLGATALRIQGEWGAIAFGLMIWIPWLVWIVWYRARHVKIGGFEVTLDGELEHLMSETRQYSDVDLVSLKGIPDSEEERNRRRLTIDEAERYVPILEGRMAGLPRGETLQNRRLLGKLCVQISNFHRQEYLLGRGKPDVDQKGVSRSLQKMRLFADRGVTFDPESPLTVGTHAVALRTQAGPTKNLVLLLLAREDYKRALVLERSADRWFNLGLTFYFERLWRDLRDEDPAAGDLLETERTCYRNSLGLEPEHAEALYNLAFVCAKLGRHADTVEYLARSFRLDSEDTKREMQKEPDRTIFLGAIRNLPPVLREEVEKTFTRYGQPWPSEGP